LWVTPFVLIRKARRRRRWQPHLVVCLTSTGWCVPHITTTAAASSSVGYMATTALENCV
jgi:hypothetical protein